jgi:hypothetical protein
MAHELMTLVTCLQFQSELPPAEQLGETAKANLRRAAENCCRLGWISFWTQLVLSSVSIVILLFSVAFSQTVRAYAPLTRFLLNLSYLSPPPPKMDLLVPPILDLHATYLVS